MSQPAIEGKILDGEFTDIQVSQPSSAIVVRQELTPNKLREEIARQTEMRSIMTDYVKKQMHEGHHYYYFNKLGKQGQAEAGGPRDDKPALTQDGSHLIMGLFRCIPGPVKTDIIRHEDGHFTVVAEAPIYNQDQALISTGNGTCSTRESKYAYRKGERLCPSCGTPAIIKGKEQYGGGWVCFGKKGGCGEKFADGDETIEKQQIGRVDNPDLADLENTVLKMACKRATVAAVRKLPLVSEVFATDPNEGPGNNDPAPAAAAAPRPVNGNRGNQRNSSPPAESSAPKKPELVQRAVDLAYKLQKDHAVEAEQLAVQFLPEGVSKFSDLTEEQAADAVPGLVELLNSKLEK